MSLRIAQIAPLWENVPPPTYGGTERIVGSLTEHLVKRGHDLTLYACGTSQTKAKLVSVYPRPLYRDGIEWTNIMYPLLNITEAFDHHKQYDILHVHLNKASDYLALPLAKEIKNKVLFTLHFPYPLAQERIGRHKIFQKYKDYNYVSISNAQRKSGENLNWLDTVYNGIEIASYNFHPNPKDYFVWIGKFNPDKGVKEAVLAAKKANVALILGGKVDQLEKEDYAYFKEEIEPHIDGKQIRYTGELNDEQKNDILGNAKAFLNPIQWNEPFGLVMTESMATGTPIIAFSQGAASEIIRDGKTGFLVNSVDEMVKKIKIINQIDRRKCRARVEKYFSSEVMTTGYEEVYYKIVKRQTSNIKQ
jgi:glycosyltransferase involved in cell wall biosynthesis